MPECFYRLIHCEDKCQNCANLIKNNAFQKYPFIGSMKTVDDNILFIHKAGNNIIVSHNCTKDIINTCGSFTKVHGIIKIDTVLGIDDYYRKLSSYLFINAFEILINVRNLKNIASKVPFDPISDNFLIDRNNTFYFKGHCLNCNSIVKGFSLESRDILR